MWHLSKEEFDLDKNDDFGGQHPQGENSIVWESGAGLFKFCLTSMEISTLIEVHVLSNSGCGSTRPEINYLHIDRP